MNSYVDKIMSNHVFDSESSTDLSYLYSDIEHSDYSDHSASYKSKRSKKSKKSKLTKNMSGGSTNVNSNDTPNGGFPPLFIVTDKEKQEEKSKNRELTSKKPGVSIKDILNSKK